MRLSQIQTCIGCNEGLMKQGKYIHWYALEVRQEMADVDAMQRVHGMELMLGGHVAIARAMGIDELIGVEVETAELVYVCFDCYLHKPLVELHEAISARRWERDADEASRA